MKMKMKRWIIIVALTLLLFPFSACNLNTSSEDYSGTSEVSASGSASEDSMDDSTDEDNTVCIVSFDTGGGTVVANQTVQRGEKIVKPNDPTKLPDSKYEYVFAGWYVNETEWNFDTNMVSEDITLTAKWDVEIYTPPFTPSD